MKFGEELALSISYMTAVFWGDIRGHISSYGMSSCNPYISKSGFNWRQSDFKASPFNCEPMNFPPYPIKMELSYEERMIIKDWGKKYDRGPKKLVGYQLK